MPVPIVDSTILPVPRSITVSIRFAVNLTAPTGIAISDITSAGFRVDIDATPSGTTVIFELSADNGLTWAVAKDSPDDFAVLAGLQSSKLYRVRAHYVSAGKHSQYATASATTLGA